MKLVKLEKINLIAAAVLVIVISAFALVGCSGEKFALSIAEKTTYVHSSTRVNSNAVATLNASLLELNERGINIGDMAEVAVGDFSRVIPVVDEIIEEEGTVQLWCNSENGTVNICVYGGNFMENYNVSVGDIVKIQEK